MSNEKELMREAWRLGIRSPAGFTITCATQKEAATVRFALYSATKQFRNGRGEPDPELAEALANCQLTIVPEGVLIQRKLATKTSQSILAALGRPPKTVEEYQVEGSLSRILARVEQASPAPEPALLTAEQQRARGYGARVRSE